MKASTKSSSEKFKNSSKMKQISKKIGLQIIKRYRRLLSKTEKSHGKELHSSLVFLALKGVKALSIMYFYAVSITYASGYGILRIFLAFLSLHVIKKMQ